MTFLLDTSVFSAVMREDSQVAAWIDSLRDQDRLIICTITRGEILFGLERLAEGRRRADLLTKANKLFDAVECVPVPAEAADVYARIKVGQQLNGLSLDENDLWLAATAIAINACLVTLDSDFSRIEALSVLMP